MASTWAARVEVLVDLAMLTVKEGRESSIVGLVATDSVTLATEVVCSGVGLRGDRAKVAKNSASKLGPPGRGPRNGRGDGAAEWGLAGPVDRRGWGRRRGGGSPTRRW